MTRSPHYPTTGWKANDVMSLFGTFFYEFVNAVQEVFPLCCIHFEDWTGVDAVHLLQRYRDKVSCYNDDIQGTASVTVAGLVNAVRIKGTKLSDEKVMFLGAGSAGIGIADLIASAMRTEGLGEEQARGRIALFDVKGYLANYADVKAAGINPLDHYDQSGWHEGRSPSLDFDTADYLAHYKDVAAAAVDPLTHFLATGIHEGRATFAEGAWG